MGSSPFKFGDRVEFTDECKRSRFFSRSPKWYRVCKSQTGIVVRIMEKPYMLVLWDGYIRNEEVFWRDLKLANG